MLIGLTGRAQAGKDTVYARCLELYSPRLIVERRSFADILYKSAAATLDVSEECLRDWKSNPYVTVEIRIGGVVRLMQMSVRQYLQRYGTEAHRNLFGADFWVDALDLTNHANRVVFVTDVRFDNEARAIIDAGGIVVEVLGPEAPTDDHPSEAGVDPNLLAGTIDNTLRDDGFAGLDHSINLVVDRALKAWRVTHVG